MLKYVGREFYAAIVSTFLAKKASNNDDDSVDYVESTENDKAMCSWASVSKQIYYSSTWKLGYA